MEGLVEDLRYAVRMLGKNPGFALLVVATLGLGIGANTAIFTLLDQVLLRLLPVTRAEELVLLDGKGPNMGAFFADQAFSYPMYRDFRDKNEVFTGVLARFPVPLSLESKGETERALGEIVSGNFFEVLGVKAALGRTLSGEDDRTPDASPVAVLDHGYWQRRFGGDPGVVGAVLKINGHAFTVVGVAAPAFHGVEVGSPPDLYVPLMMKAAITPTWNELQNRRFMWLNVMARLKPGVSPVQAAAGLQVLYRQINEQELAEMPDPSARFRERFLAKQILVLPGFRGLSSLRQQFTTPLLVLTGMVGLVLLIACANVANLLLARAASREREIAVRLALGARRGHIVRQLLVESLLLAGLGGALGLVLSSWVGGALLRALPFEQAGRSLSAVPDGRVLFFTLAVSLATGIVFGLVPAWQTTRPKLTAALKNESGAVVGGSHVRFRKGLVVAQVALSLLLLIGAGLFARSLYNLRTLDPGFAVQRLMSLTVDPSLNGYTPERMLPFFRQLQERFGSVPSVTAASFVAEPIMADARSIRTTNVLGYQTKEEEDTNLEVNQVGPAYFATMQIPVLSGREFDGRDVAGAPKVAVVNEATARYFFGTTSPIGRRLGFGPNDSDYEIVGVVKEGKSYSLRDKSQRFVYTAYLQDDNPSAATFYVRTSGTPDPVSASLRAMVREADAAMPVFRMRTMEAQVDESLFFDRMVAALSAAFGLLATLLAGVGLYGVMSYTVLRRTREIGIRMALGAERGRVLWLVLREVAILATLGVGLGLPSALGLSRLIESQLFGLSPTDPLTLGLATIVLLSVALLAGYLPASRATRVDPMAALRYE